MRYLYLSIPLFLSLSPSLPLFLPFSINLSHLLPCEETKKTSLSKKPTMVALWSLSFYLQNNKKWMFVVQATQSTAFCYGSPNWLANGMPHFSRSYLGPPKVISPPPSPFRRMPTKEFLVLSTQSLPPPTEIGGVDIEMDQSMTLGQALLAQGI